MIGQSCKEVQTTDQIVGYFHNSGRKLFCKTSLVFGTAVLMRSVWYKGYTWQIKCAPPTHDTQLDNWISDHPPYHERYRNFSS